MGGGDTLHFPPWIFSGVLLDYWELVFSVVIQKFAGIHAILL